MANLQVSCSDCGAAFVFSDAERAFYEGKGLSYPPKRCKACRLAKKGSPSAPKGHRGARPLHDIVCTACGAREQVPFRPAAGRDVYCRACHRARQPDPSGGPPSIDVRDIDVKDEDAGIVE